MPPPVPPLKTALITGGEGMLAQDVRSALIATGRWRVTAPSRLDLDITDADGVAGHIAAVKPDAVINTAVLHVDPSENSPEDAFRVNAWGVRNLAIACEAADAMLVQISTCGLFGDEVRPYDEYDPVVLKTVYARSKHAGERYAAELCSRTLILRLGWLFGGSPAHSRNFVAARIREAQAAEGALQSASDKHGSPTYTGDVADRLISLLEMGEMGAVGLFHLANSGAASRAEYVRQILASAGLDTAVEDVDSSHFPRVAPVPDCEVLTSLNLGYAGLSPMPPWTEAIDRYVRSIRQKLA
jgi:dTDP-4-dehydrorhamnose reductase